MTNQGVRRPIQVDIVLEREGAEASDDGRSQEESLQPGHYTTSQLEAAVQCT